MIANVRDREKLKEVIAAIFWVIAFALTLFALVVCFDKPAEVWRETIFDKLPEPILAVLGQIHLLFAVGLTLFLSVRSLRKVLLHRGDKKIARE